MQARFASDKNSGLFVPSEDAKPGRET